MCRLPHDRYARLGRGQQKKDFVGSQKCQGCHSEEFKSWKATFHAKMVQPRKGGILKAAVENWESDGANPGPTKGNVTGT